MVCAVSRPDHAPLGIRELVLAHGGDLRAWDAGWWSASFPAFEAAERFAVEIHARSETVSTALLPGDDALTLHQAGVLAMAAPQGACWTSESVGRARDVGVQQVEVGPVRVTVGALRQGAGPRAPWRHSAHRSADLGAIESLFSLGIRVVCVSGEAGAGVSRLLRERSIDGLYIDLHDVDEPWTLLHLLAEAWRVPLDERRSLERGVNAVLAGFRAAAPSLTALDHMHEDLVPYVRPLLASGRWLLGGVDRAGVSAEAHYTLGAPDGPQESLHPALSEAVDAHPLASRVLVAGVKPPVHFRWLERMHAGQDVRMALTELLPPRVREVLPELSVVPHRVPLQGLRTVAKLGREELAWLFDSGLLEHQERGTHVVRVSSWLRQIEVPAEEAVEAVRAWSRWLVECTEQWLDHESPWVLRRLHADRPLLSACVQGLLEVPRPTAADLGLIAALLRAQTALAVNVGPAAALLDPFDLALTAVGRSFDVGPDVAIALLRNRARILTHLERFDAALADLERAAGLATRVKRESEQVRIRLLLAETHLRRGRRDEAETSLHGLEEVPEAGSTLGAAHMAAGRLEDAAQAFERAQSADLDMFEKAVLAGRRALLARRTQDREGAVAFYRTAVDLWAQLGRYERLMFAHFRLGTALQTLNRLAEAESEYGIAIDLARRAGDESRLARVLVQRGLLALERGDGEAAKQHFQDGLTAARAGGDRGAQGSATGFLALTEQFKGRAGAARGGYRAALRDLESGQERRFSALFHSCLAVTEAELGNLAEARILLDLGRMQMPYADEGMRAAIELFSGILDVAEGHATQDDALLRRAEAQLDATVQVDNVYVRFVRRYLRSMLD